MLRRCLLRYLRCLHVMLQLHVGASIAAAFFSCTFSAPADIVMTRYQAAEVMGRSYAGPVDCVKTLVREEGMAVFFRGWSPFFVRVVPLFTINLPLYEQIRRLFGIGYLD
jgi:dicarboxylate transporter 10